MTRLNQDSDASLETQNVGADTLSDQLTLPEALHDPLPTELAREAYGRYVVETELGRGGMGVVYRAHDPQLGRAVAVKVLLHAEVDDAARMIREARSVARLAHPNVVSVFDFGVADDLPYLVMEYVRGRTLREWLKGRRRPWRRVLKVFEAAARGVGAAHEIGLVHRDFKPANVLLGPRGVVKVLDFGLARAPGGSEETTVSLDGQVHLDAATLTRTGVAMGTPSFMSPEQHSGQELDTSTDVFAFGVSLYSALYGSVPFAGEDVERLLQAKLRGVAAQSPRDDIPSELHEFLVSMLHAEPSERPTMRDVAVGLRRIRSGKRRRWGWALGVVAAGGVAGVFALPSAPAEVAEEPASAAAFSDPVAEAEALALARDAEAAGASAEPARSLGIAYGALLVAAGSGSAEANARASYELASALARLGFHAQAAPEFANAVELLTSAELHETAIDAAVSLTHAHYMVGDISAATESQRMAHAMAVRTGHTKTPAVEVRLLEGDAKLAAVVGDKDPIRIMNRVIEIRREFKEDEPEKLAAALFNLLILERDRDLARARELALEARELYARVDGGEGTGSLRVRATLAGIEGSLGNFELCIAMAKAVHAASGPGMELQAFEAAGTIAGCLTRSDDGEGGLEWSIKAIEVAEGAPEIFSPLLRSVAYTKKGFALQQLERFDEAAAAYHRALVLAESSEDTPPGYLGELLIVAGELSRSHERETEALAYYERALEKALTDHGRERVEIGIGETYYQLGKYEDALERLTIERDPQAAGIPGRTITWLRADAYRARCLWELGRVNEARVLATKTMRSLEEHAEGERQGGQLDTWMRAAPRRWR